MLALVKTARGSGHLALQELPEPRTRPDDILIRVHARGICSSDLKI